MIQNATTSRQVLTPTRLQSFLDRSTAKSDEQARAGNLPRIVCPAPARARPRRRPRRENRNRRPNPSGRRVGRSGHASSAAEPAGRRALPPTPTVPTYDQYTAGADSD
jgi:hypothetical protein